MSRWPRVKWSCWLRTKRALFCGFLLITVGIGFAVYQGSLGVPSRWNPRAPLDVNEPAEQFLRWKLARLSTNTEECQNTLQQTALRYQLVADKETGAGCGFANAVTMEATAAGPIEPFTLSCPAAVSLALWERHVLQPAAQRELGSRVSGLAHFGSYACRGLYGRETARRSQHATANAFDFAGVVLEDGRRIRVASHWSDATNESRFLQAIHEGACRYFDTVLGPEYNTAHLDHFHLDRGKVRVCR